MSSPVCDVWLVIPLFNEVTMIADVVSQARTRFTHVVCIDDGSTDGSGEAARAAGARVLRHPVNLGQGAALQTGIEYVLRQPEAEYLVTYDADGQHQLSDAVAMVALAREQDLGIVFGSRFLDDRTDAGWLKKIVLKFAVWFTNKSTGIRLTDAHNGLRVLRRDAAAGVHLTQDKMAHASEIVLHLARTGLPWREYPVHVLYTDYSRSKGQSLLNSVNILVDLISK